MVSAGDHARLGAHQRDRLPVAGGTGGRVGRAARRARYRRDLLGDFQRAGFTYAANATQLKAIPATTTKLLGLFTLSNLNTASDRIDGRRGNPRIVNDYGFPDQPMLEERRWPPRCRC